MWLVRLTIKKPMNQIDPKWSVFIPYGLAKRSSWKVCISNQLL